MHVFALMLSALSSNCAFGAEHAQVEALILEARSATTAASREAALDQALLRLEPDRPCVFQPVRHPHSERANMERFSRLAASDDDALHGLGPPAGLYTRLTWFDAPGPVGLALIRRAELRIELSDRVLRSNLPPRLDGRQTCVYEQELARVAIRHRQDARRDLIRGIGLLQDAGRLQRHPESRTLLERVEARLAAARQLGKVDCGSD